MRQGYSENALSSGATPEGPAPLLSVPLQIEDHCGRKRRGLAVLLRSWPADPAGERPAEGEDFRIVILLEPPDGPICPAQGVVVSTPVRSLTSTGTRVGEPATTYAVAEKADLALSAKDIGLLEQGDLFAATPLQVTAEDVFAGGKARLTLLACELLASEALVEQTMPIAIALNAPSAARPAGRERLDELKELINAAGGAAFGEDDSEPTRAIAHLSELVFAANQEQFLVLSERIYPDKRALMEDIYLLRAFLQSPEQARQLLSMRRFLQQAAVPADEAELAVDRAVALEQLTFAALAVEPHRHPSATAIVESFRRKYISAYRDHHTRYWGAMARLHSRLREEQTMMETLQRLNTLAELGPPIGVGALAAYEELVAETAGCPLISGVEEMLEAEAICPACRLSLDQETPGQRIDEILTRIERACDGQMARLSSAAIQQVLHRSGNPRVEQFLQMIQASQLSSLRNTLDDELVGYLRRFLVESRIEEALQPILSQLQEGVPPKVDDAQTAMREVSRVLQRAFQAAQRALPPAETPGETIEGAKAAPPRRQRKR